MFTLARESRGLTQSELATQAKITQGALSKIEAGSMSANEETAKAIARVLGYPVSFFMQTDPVFPFGSSTFYHRKLQSVPIATLRKIEARVNIYRMQIVRLLRSTDLHTRLRFRKFDPEEHGNRIEEIAGLVRATWRLPAGPVQNLTRAIEDAGGIVIRFPFGTAKMWGISEWMPPAPPLFFLNDNAEVPADRDRFTLAHELGHVLLHTIPTPNMEDEANRFAAEFLMPEVEIRSHLEPPIKLHTVARLKPYWKVSMASLMHRAKELGIITGNQYTYLRIQLQEKGYGTREPRELDIEREQPTLLAEIIREHIRHLDFTENDFGAVLNALPNDFREYYPVQGRSGLKVVNFR